MNWLRNLLGLRHPSMKTPAPQQDVKPLNGQKTQSGNVTVRRHFYNQTGFQTYGSFFRLWDGWATAGHVLSEASDLLPDFCTGEVYSWPNGLDGALIGCTLPSVSPAPPRVGQNLIVKGYPAGSRHIEERRAKTYYERHPGVWIAHIIMPDEPVVTGMSGGAVIDAGTGEVVGILITRNSPADLNADRDPDESCDFVALSAIWDAVTRAQNIA